MRLSFSLPRQSASRRLQSVGRAIRRLAFGPSARRGATTLEFAVVGSTATLLLVVVALLGAYFLRLTMLDLAVQKAARIILMDQTVTQTQLVNDIQSYSLGLLGGQTVYVAVQSGSTFAGITPTANVSTGGGGSLPFSPGTNGSDVLLQAGYQDNTLSHFLPTFLTNISSTIAFQIEPAGQ
jgi:hypothetical protein